MLAIDLFRVTDTPINAAAFAHLRRHALCYSLNVADLSSALTMADVPHLKDLALVVTGPDQEAIEDSMRRLGEMIRPRAAKVRRLYFASVPSQGALPQEVWMAFSALEYLVLDQESPMSWVLLSLPTRRTSFRLRSLLDFSEALNMGRLLTACDASSISSTRFAFRAHLCHGGLLDRRGGGPSYSVCVVSEASRSPGGKR